MVLASLCTAYSTMIQAQEGLQKSGLLTKTASGYVQQNPLLGIANTAMAQVYRHAREFGLSPSSRTRIAMEGAIPDVVTGLGSLGRKMAAGRRLRAG